MESERGTSIFSRIHTPHTHTVIHTYTHRKGEWGETDAEHGADVIVTHSAGDCSPKAYNWEIIAQFSATDNAQSILEPISISYQEQAPETVNIKMVCN